MLGFGKGKGFSAEKVAWVRLSRTEGIGPVRMAQLISRFGSAERAIEAFPTLEAFKNKTLAPLSKIEDEIAESHMHKAHMVCFYEDDYPEALRMTSDAPPVLTVRGDLSLLSMRGVGIVGTRNASMNGRKMTQMLAADIGKEDYTIISGLARGIDSAAHRAALDAGAKTIAVIAGGANDIYPRENDALYHEICEKGAVVSEMPWGTKATAKLFPKRNRIVSGLSLALIVVEAAMRSGSLITARLAAEQGREVYAVPGSPLDGRAAGPNALIQQGAKLVMGAEDILEDIASMAPRPVVRERNKESASLFDFKEDQAKKAPAIPSDVGEDAPLELKILNSLSTIPSEVDDLIRVVNAPASAVQTALIMLEMDQKVERIHGNRVALCA